jgi:putative transcriptional regulator
MGRFAEALEDVRRLANGDARGCIVDTMHIRRVPDFTPAEIRALRHAAKMPQRTFAECLGVTQKTIESWEGGRSHPDGAARRLLGLLQDDPDFFRKSGIFRHKRTVVAHRQSASPKTHLSPVPALAPLV